MLVIRFPLLIAVKNEKTTNSPDIVNAFNKYFAKDVIDIQPFIQLSKKKYFHYLPPLNIELFVITLTGSTEVPNNVSTLNQDKSDGTNSVPTKTLKKLS